MRSQLQLDFSSIRNELPPLDFLTPIVQTPVIQRYCAYYHLQFSETSHRLGTFRSGTYELVAQIFTPISFQDGKIQPPQGTVFLLHGYIDHTGIQRHLIQNCLEQNWAVATYDLPGHGLSSGKRMAIDDFSEYADVFHTFLQLCQPYLPRPHFFIGHSTGCAIALEYFSHIAHNDFDRMIFLAPLVRHVHWHISKIPYFFGTLLHTRTVPRRYSEISSDQTFLQRLRQDPLQTNRVPFIWIKALYAWNQKIQSTPELPIDIFILQGTRDTVVDRTYNIPFLQQKFRRTTVKWIKHAGHQLSNEIPAIRTQVFQNINAYLTGKGI